MPISLPLRIIRHEGSFGIRDAVETTLCFVYFDKGTATERSIRKLMSEEEAEALAKRVARFLTDDAETQKDPASRS